MGNSNDYNIFDHPDLIEKEEGIDKAIKAAEIENNRNMQYDITMAIKWHSRELIDRIILKYVHDPNDISANKYIDILKKYTGAFELVENPHYSIDIEMEIKNNVHKIWKDFPPITEKLPEEIERFGLVDDYPSDLITKYNEIKDKSPESLTNNQIINLERAWSGAYHIYLDYFLILELITKDYEKPDFIIKDYEKICDNPVKFGNVINSMHGSLIYARYHNQETLKFRIGVIIKSALEKRQDFIDTIPTKLSGLVDEQIMSIIKSRNKNLDGIIYEVPDSYTNQYFLAKVEQALSKNELIDKDFFSWLLNRRNYGIR